MVTELVNLFHDLGDVLLKAEIAIAVAGVILGALAMFFLMSYLLQVVAYWRLFKKAGQGGWKSLIPIYSSYIRYKISWRPLWFWISGFLIALGFVLEGFFGQYPIERAASVVVTITGWVIYAMSMYKLSRAFGHGFLYAIGLIFLQPLFTMILGFGVSPWLGEAKQRGDEEN